VAVLSQAPQHEDVCEARIKLDVILISVPDGAEWLVSRSSRFVPLDMSLGGFEGRGFSAAAKTEPQLLGGSVRIIVNTIKLVLRGKFYRKCMVRI
jgi:hypothetical protein